MENELAEIKEALKTKCTFKSKKNQAKCEYISNLLDTAINHIGG